MKKIYILPILFLSSKALCLEFYGFYPYASVGIGYKFEEPRILESSRKTSDIHFESGDSVSVDEYYEKTYVDFGSKDSALLEIGLENKYISFGFKHDSQWSSGFPFNNRDEYFKTEIFLRYKIGGYP